MSIKSDKWIRMMATEYRMIEPYEPGQIKEVEGKRIVSYGTSSYGYDIRCADEFKLFTNINSTIVDPKEFDEKNFVDIRGDAVIIPPNSFALARTVEYFRIPRNVLTICLGKSTYARCGILVNVTPFEPEWEGYVTLEFSNTTPHPQRFTPTKASPRSSSSNPTRTTSAKPPTRIAAANTRANAASHYRRCSLRNFCAFLWLTNTLNKTSPFPPAVCENM
jgi:dCTP deaminase